MRHVESDIAPDYERNDKSVNIIADKTTYALLTWIERDLGITYILEQGINPTSQ